MKGPITKWAWEVRNGRREPISDEDLRRNRILMLIGFGVLVVLYLLEHPPS